MSDRTKTYSIPIYISWVLINEKMYIVDERDNELYELEEVGAEIMFSLINGKMLEEILELVVRKTGQSIDEIESMVIDFIDELEESGMIKTYA